MDVRMPDGTIVANVPDGTSKDEVLRRYNAKHAPAADPTADGTGTLQFGPLDTGIKIPAGVENFLAGAGKGVMDKVEGAKQFAASVGLGDSAKLNADAAERQRLEAPLMATGTGKSGEIAGSMIPELALGGTSLLRSARFLPSVLKAIGFGAADAQLTPSTNYDPARNAEWGAAFGFGGDMLGRGAGRLVQPFRAGGSARTMENVDVLKQAGMPDPRMVNLSDSRMIKSATDAMEQTPLGRFVTGPREKNLDWYNRLLTAPTGTEAGQLTPSVERAMHGRLDTTGTAFRNGPDVPIPNLPQELQDVADQIGGYARATGSNNVPKKLYQAAEELKPSASPIVSPSGLPFTSSTPPTLPAGTIMDLRRAASTLANNTEDPILSAGYRAARGHYDQALKDTLPDVPNASGQLTKSDFDNWLKQWGAMEEVKSAAGKGGMGLDQEGHLLPQSVVKSPNVKSFGPTDPLDKITVAAADRIPQPTPGFNRAMVTAMLLGGAPIAGGAASDVARGNFGPGTTTGLGVSAALLRGLLGKQVDPSTVDLLRRLLMTGATSQLNQHIPQN